MTTANPLRFNLPSDGVTRASRTLWKREPYELELLRNGSPRDAGDTRPLPIFILGHPRSGTNWLSNLLNLHPLIATGGELHFHVLLNVMPELISEPHQAGFRDPVRSALARGFQEYLRTAMASIASQKPGAKWVADHTPRLLRPMLPEASHILITRDGRDVAISLTVHLLNCQSRRYAQGNKEISGLFDQAMKRCTPDDASLNGVGDWLLTHEPWVRNIAANWQRHVLSDLAMIERIERGDLSARILQIRYEDLHADTPTHLRRMFEFVGADPAQAAPIGADPRTTAGYTNNAPNSHYRRGKAGDWRNRLSADAVRWFNESAGEGLRALGYDLDDNSAGPRK